MTQQTAPAVVEMTGISVEFPPVKALDGVDFSLRPGEIHALMGENGAGKSTLIKALTGIHSPTAGTIVVDGVERRFTGPADARAHGVEHRVPGGEPLREPHGRGEHHARRRAAVAGRPALVGDAPSGGVAPGADGPEHRPGVVARVALARGAAARRDLSRHGGRLQGAHPRRAHLQPGHRRGGAPVHRHACPARRRRRHPVREPLPRPDLRGLRPHDGAAQRRPGGGVRHRRAARRRAGRST